MTRLASNKELNDWIADCYAAVVAPARWCEQMQSLGRRVGADGWHLLGWDEASQASLLSLGAPQMGQAVFDDYVNTWGAVDPRQALTRRSPSGHVTNCHRDLGDRFIARDPFFQDFFIPFGMRYSMGVKLFERGQQTFLAGFFRDLERPPFDAADEQQLSLCSFHLGRALQLVLRQEQQQSVAQAQQVGLLAGSLGVMVLSPHGHLQWANAQAERWLRQAQLWRIREGVLLCGRTERVSAWLGAVAAAAAGECRQWLQEPAGQDRVAMTLLPCSGQLMPGENCNPRNAGVLCLMAPTEARRCCSERDLMAWFGLSPAEARLTRMLGQGMRLEQCATTLGLRVSTIKTQLRAALEKTHTDRQAELVRLVAGLPALRTRSQGVTG